MKDFPNRQNVDALGVQFAFYEMNGDPDAKRPPIILIHGWPEIAYSWRNQIAPLAEAGFRVIALDLKGYGWSDCPRDPSLYSIDQITSEIAAVLDKFGIDKAIFCGHDWGGSIVWSMGQWQADRVAGIIGVCTPLKARPPVPPLMILEKRFTAKHYIVQFQKPDLAEEVFSQDVERFVQMMFRSPAPRERWPDLIPDVYDLLGRFQSDLPAHRGDLIVSPSVIDAYVEAFTHSGFHGGINYYRNIDRNWALMEGREEVVARPGLWIGADLDMFLPPESADGMDALVPDLETKIIENSGHWVMAEQPDVLISHLLDWLTRRFST